MDGVLEHDDVALRQLPYRHTPWAHTLWVSETGALFPRLFLVASRSWRWLPARTPRFDALGRQGHYVDATFRTLEQLVALAWCAGEPPRGLHLVRHHPEEPLYAHNLEWVETTSVEVESAAPRRWRAIAEVRLGLICCGTDCEVSTDAQLRAGGVLLPTFRSLGHIFAHAPHVGLVPVDLLRDVLFGAKRPPPPPPRLRLVLDLLPHATPHTLACALGIRQSTAWSYLRDALRHLSTRRAAAVTARFVGTELDQLVRALPDVCDQPLRELVHHVDRALAADRDWRTRADRYARVVLVRDVLRRELS